MGILRKPKPVKFFVGVITNDAGLAVKASEEIAGKMGRVESVSDPIPFDFTEYYNEEMGQGLVRCFIELRDLMDPLKLKEFKLYTNDLEEKLGKTENGQIKRNINLDPGYLMLDKMVLASTKNFRHRIYLGRCIYGEVTLYWSKGNFHFFDYTFPDYRTQCYRDYFRKLMLKYRDQLKNCAGEE